MQCKVVNKQIIDVAGTDFNTAVESQDQLVYRPVAPAREVYWLISPSSRHKIGSSTRMSSEPDQSPAHKRQKISSSKPFRFESSQPCNPQTPKAEAAPNPMKQSVTDESPKPQPLQGIQAEWPKRGRTNERGQAPITAGCSPAQRSQNSPCAPVLPKSLSCSLSVSPFTANCLAEEYLLQAGMDAPPPDLHEFAPTMRSYLEFLLDLQEKFIPLTLKVYRDLSRPATLPKLTIFG